MTPSQGWSDCPVCGERLLDESKIIHSVPPEQETAARLGSFRARVVAGAFLLGGKLWGQGTITSHLRMSGKGAVATAVA